MKKRILILPLVATFFLISCKKDAKSENVISTETTPSIETDVLTNPKDSLEVVNTIIKNKEGQELQLLINNKNNQAIVVLQGDSIKLDEKPAASGIWYSNDHYELRGKGEQVTLTKDGKSVFTNE